MIVPMHKVTLLCLGHDVEETLTSLRELGVLHLTHTVPPQGDDLESLRRELALAEQAVQELTHHAEHGMASPASGAPDAETFPTLVQELVDKRKAREEACHHLHLKIEAITPYGDFDPTLVQDLEKRGISVRLFEIAGHELPDAPDGATWLPLGDDQNVTYAVLVGAPETEVNATEFSLPDESLSALRADLAAKERAAEEDEDTLRTYAADLPGLADHVRTLTEQVIFAEARGGMSRDRQVAYLRGFCPDDQLEALRGKARESGWGLLSEEPADDEPVPTLLRYPRWVRPIRAMYEGLAILPGYREADISAVFLVFFSIFFALLIGDAGYGALFLAATLWARRRLPKAPAYPFTLFGILSTCAIVWGAITGNYFGLSPERLPGILQGLQVPWFTGGNAQGNVMRLCFLIGAVHLTIAHVWNAISLAPSLQALAELGWIAIAWCMFMVALNMVLQVALPGLFLPLLLVGIVLVVLFMTPPKKLKADWIQHAMLPLSVVNCFVDIVSYIRLFAVGLASLSVAQSFNGMAADVGISRVWTVPFFALILLLGHGLNIILCALGILVHGVRLNTLEFSLHKNMEWKGFAYAPFKRRS